jgi:hypothetical protein
MNHSKLTKLDRSNLVRDRVLTRYPLKLIAH